MDDHGRLLPIFDENYLEALNKWWAEHRLFQEGKHPDQLAGSLSDSPKIKYFAQWHGDPPAVDTYRFYRDEECTHFQFYETVTEGTPLSPVFETLQQLEDWMVAVGECAGTEYAKKYSREGAKAFCASGWAPSFVLTPATGIISGVEASAL